MGHYLARLYETQQQRKLFGREVPKAEDSLGRHICWLARSLFCLRVLLLLGATQPHPESMPLDYLTSIPGRLLGRASLRLLPWGVIRAHASRGPR